MLRSYGAIPVTYGPGLADRVRAIAPDGVDAAIDTVGTDEAVDTSLELVADTAPHRVDRGFRARRQRDRADQRRRPGDRMSGRTPGGRLLPAAADGSLKIVVARTYPLAEAAEALRFVRDGHAGGKVVLLP